MLSLLWCHVYAFLSTVVISCMLFVVPIYVLFKAMPPNIDVFMVTNVVISSLGIIIRFIRPFLPMRSPE